MLSTKVQRREDRKDLAEEKILEQISKEVGGLDVDICRKSVPGSGNGK